MFDLDESVEWEDLMQGDLARSARNLSVATSFLMMAFLWELDGIGVKDIHIVLVVKTENWFY